MTKRTVRRVTTTIEENKPRKIKNSRKRKLRTYHMSKTNLSTAKSLDKILVENLIELQKVHVEVIEKFDKLSSEISQLLALFEMAARSFAKNPAIKTSEKDHDFLEKIDKLLEQNKTIAKGLTLMEEKIRERMYGSNNPSSLIPKPQTSQSTTEEYQPSISGNRPLPKF